MWTLLKQTFAKWSADRAQSQGAALAYFTIFSLAPLLVIVISVAGIVYGPEAVQGSLVKTIESFVGPGPATAIQELIKTTYHAKTGLAMVISAVVSVIGASAAFVQLQDSLNLMWGVAPRPDRGVMGIIKDRFFSFVMVLCAGVLMLALLVASVVIATLGTYFANSIPGSETVWHLISEGFSFLVFTLIFAVLFKYVPDVKVPWRDVWAGAALTAALFVIGKVLIGLYIGKTGVASAYGAAGSLALLLIWVYYSAQIIFFGAEFTLTYAQQRGDAIEPEDNALPIEEVQRMEGYAGGVGRATARRSNAQPRRAGTPSPSGREIQPPKPPMS
jgi:membrane protein